MNFKKGYTPHNKGIKKWFIPNDEINRSEWTDNELDFIKANLLKMSNAELGYHLKRTISQIKRKLERHILRRGKSFIPATLRKDYDPLKPKLKRKVKKKKKKIVKVVKPKKIKEVKKKERIIFSRIIDKPKPKKETKKETKVIIKKKQIPIYIDRRTTVYVDCETKIEQVRNKYLEINRLKYLQNKK